MVRRMSQSNHKDAVVLAYSGGLDTTFCALFLNKVKAMEVHAVTVNTGGFTEKEIDAIKERVLQIGVASFEVIDVTKQYYEECIRFLVYGNVLKNSTYPLSVSAERIIQAKAIADYAKKCGISCIAHGST